jgi:hypothetical protein
MSRSLHVQAQRHDLRRALAAGDGDLARSIRRSLLTESIDVAERAAAHVLLTHAGFSPAELVPLAMPGLAMAFDSYTLSLDSWERHAWRATVGVVQANIVHVRRVAGLSAFGATPTTSAGALELAKVVAMHRVETALAGWLGGEPLDLFPDDVGELAPPRRVDHPAAAWLLRLGGVR